MKVRGSLLGLLAALALALVSVTGALAQSATPEASPVPAGDCGTLMGIGAAG